MRFDWSTEQDAFRRELAAFADAHRGAPDDRSDLREVASEDGLESARTFVRGLAERGWLAPHWPAEYGGQDDSWRHIILGEELWARGEPRGPQYMNVNWVAPLLMMAGTEEQRATHLARIREGSVTWCQGFSEPDSGTDLASLRTSARYDGDHYVVDGHKTWTSYAHVADFCFTLVRTGPDRGPDERGITILLIAMDSPGIEVREIPGLAGPHQFHEVYFTGVQVPAAARLGEEHKGWDLVRRGLEYERVGSPRYAAAQVELDRLAAWCRDRGRGQESQTLAALGRGQAACDAARLLTYQAIDEREKGVHSSNANVARAAMVRAERTVADVTTELMGPHGLGKDSIAERQRLNGLVAGIASGTYEVQLNLIAGQGLGLPSGRH